MKEKNPFFFFEVPYGPLTNTSYICSNRGCMAIEWGGGWSLGVHEMTMSGVLF